MELLLKVEILLNALLLMGKQLVSGADLLLKQSILNELYTVLHLLILQKHNLNTKLYNMKRSTKKLELKKFKIATLNHLQFVKGGGDPTTVKSNEPTECDDPTQGG